MFTQNWSVPIDLDTHFNFQYACVTENTNFEKQICGIINLYNTDVSLEH